MAAINSFGSTGVHKCEVIPLLHLWIHSLCSSPISIKLYLAQSEHSFLSPTFVTFSTIICLNRIFDLHTMDFCLALEQFNCQWEVFVLLILTLEIMGCVVLEKIVRDFSQGGETEWFLKQWKLVTNWVFSSQQMIQFVDIYRKTIA